MTRLPEESGSDGGGSGARGPSSALVYATDSMPGERISTLLDRRLASLHLDAVAEAAAVRSRLRSGDVACLVVAAGETDFDERPAGRESNDAERFPAALQSMLAAAGEERPSVPVVLVGPGLSTDIVVSALDAGVTDVHRMERDEVERIRKRDPAADAAVPPPVIELAARVERAVDEFRRTRDRSEERRRLETIVDNFPGIIYRCRLEPGWPMEYVRGESRALTGYSCTELETNEYSWGRDVIYPNDRDRVYESVYDEIDTSGPFELTYRIVTRDDTTKWVWERGRLVESTTTDGPRIEGFITDVTDRRERTEQLQVISHLLRHNVRNDMTVVRGYAQLLAEETDDFADETATMVDRIDDLLTTVDKTQPIVDVLTNPHDRGVVDIADAIERAAATVEGRYEIPAIEVSVESAAVAAIPELERAFAELLENAAIHTAAAEPTIAVRATCDEETVTVDVLDDGPVIPDMERDILSGERTPEPLYHGTGLGLWLVEWIVRRSGGTVSFGETDAGGNVVTVKLPRWD